MNKKMVLTKQDDACPKCGYTNTAPSNNTVGACEGDIFHCSNCDEPIQVVMVNGKRTITKAPPAW